MANSTIIYACTVNGLAVFNKPGTLPEWLPPRRVLADHDVVSAWAEAGPPIRVAAVANGTLLLSGNGGRNWEEVKLAARPLALWSSVREEGQEILYVATIEGGISSSQDGGLTWIELPPLSSAGFKIKAVHSYGSQTLLVLEENIGSKLLVGDPETNSWRVLVTGGIADAGYDPESGALYVASGPKIKRGKIEWEEPAELPNSPNATVLTVIPGPKAKPPTVLTGSKEGLFISSDEGENWSEVALPHSGAVVAFARDPERRDRVYMALSTGYIVESANRGASWEPVNSRPLEAIHSLYIMRI